MVGCSATSKKSADRRCSSRLRMPVRTDAACMRRRPSTAPGAVTLPVPSTSVNVPLTLDRPHIVGLRKVTSDLCGSSCQLPAQPLIAMIRSSPIHQGGHIGRLEVLVDTGDQAVGSHLDHDAYPQIDRFTVG